MLYPPEFEKVISEIGRVIRENHTFLVCGHVRPDGDCVGSQLAFYHLLLNMEKGVRLYNSGPILEHYKFMPGIDRFETELDKSYQPDVSIFVDCGTQDRVTGNFTPPGFLINIDHHRSNGHFGDLNYIDTGATAAGEQIYHIIRHMGEPVTPDIAASVYLAVLSDSGSFRFSNTNDVTLKVAADCVAEGADPAWIAGQFYDNRSPESVNLKAKALSSLHYECGGKLVWSEITWDMYESAGGTLNEPEGLVGEMRGIRGVDMSILFHELEEGGMRSGLRSKGDVDVSKVARKMGGGGHKNASGCYIQGNYRELRDQMIRNACDYFSEVS